MGEAMQEALYAVCVPLLRRLGGRRGAVALDESAMVADQRALRRRDTCNPRLPYTGSYARGVARVPRP